MKWNMKGVVSDIIVDTFKYDEEEKQENRKSELLINHIFAVIYYTIRWN